MLLNFFVYLINKKLFSRFLINLLKFSFVKVVNI